VQCVGVSWLFCAYLHVCAWSRANSRTCAALRLGPGRLWSTLAEAQHARPGQRGHARGGIAPGCECLTLKNVHAMCGSFAAPAQVWRWTRFGAERLRKTGRDHAGFFSRASVLHLALRPPRSLGRQVAVLRMQLLKCLRPDGLSICSPFAPGGARGPV